jgi:hypothetical protein
MERYCLHARQWAKHAPAVSRTPTLFTGFGYVVRRHSGTPLAQPGRLCPGMTPTSLFKPPSKETSNAPRYMYHLDGGPLLGEPKITRRSLGRRLSFHGQPPPHTGCHPGEGRVFHRHRPTAPHPGRFPTRTFPNLVDSRCRIPTVDIWQPSGMPLVQSSTIQHSGSHSATMLGIP